jgi:hypothetical protein
MEGSYQYYMQAAINWRRKLRVMSAKPYSHMSAKPSVESRLVSKSNTLPIETANRYATIETCEKGTKETEN